MKALKGKIISFLVLSILISSTTTYVYADAYQPPSLITRHALIIIIPIILLVCGAVFIIIMIIHNKK